jgi:putative membrane protein insertion efficiency factor
MKYVCVGLIRLYRKLVSPLTPPCCRFYPTCSEYAAQAFARHGFFAGLVLSAYRLTRCNPFCRPGYDPVPDRIIWKKIFKRG